MKCAGAIARTRSARRGITIIEIMIVITGVAMMLGLCAVSIQILLRLSADGMSRYGAAVAIERLGRQVRTDAHASQTAEVAGDQKDSSKPGSLRLVLEPGHVVAYGPAAAAVVRTETRGGKVIRHESFALRRGTEARFELRELASRRMVALVVSHAAATNQIEPPRPLDVVALLGKDRTGLPLKRKGHAR
jgi:hypothetical protein